MNAGKVFLGVLAVVTAGALLCVLFAPDKGSDIRSKIIKEGEDYLDSVKGKFNSLLDNMAGKFNGGKADISDVVDSKRKEVKRDMQPTAG